MEYLNDEDRQFFLDAMSKPFRLLQWTYIRKVVQLMQFDNVLDLHGYTVHDANMIFCQYIDTAKSININHVIIITGKSGIIRQEFPHWIEGNIYITKAKMINEGSFSLLLKS